MKNKPLVFEAACIFSIIGSSIGFISMFIAVFFFHTVVEKIKLLTNITATDKLNPFYFALIGAAFSISLIGAIKLQRLKKSGIYYYMVAQITVMFIPVIHLGSDAFSVTNSIFALLFSGIYLYFYKLLS